MSVNEFWFHSFRSVSSHVVAKHVKPSELFSANVAIDRGVKVKEREETSLIELLEEITTVGLILWFLGRMFISPIS